MNSYLSDCTGNDALGLESGLIVDQQISASSQASSSQGPANARLNHVAIRGKMSAWSAQTNDENQWLQVDFGQNVKITKIATQGRQDYEQWVANYTLSYCEDGKTEFQEYQENDADKVTRA